MLFVSITFGLFFPIITTNVIIVAIIAIIAITNIITIYIVVVADEVDVDVSFADVAVAHWIVAEVLPIGWQSTIIRNSLFKHFNKLYK